MTGTSGPAYFTPLFVHNHPILGPDMVHVVACDGEGLLYERVEMMVKEYLDGFWSANR